MDTLEQSLQVPPETDSSFREFGHHVADLFDQLSRVHGGDESRLARLEWAYFPLLANGPRRTSARFLHRELARNPDFFSDVVALLYPGEGEEPRDLSDEDRMRVRHGHSLLHSWRTLPGTMEDASIDAAILKEWVDRARRILRVRNREAIGDQMVGAALSASPPGTDGLWPHEAVRDIIEDVGTRHLEAGIELGIRNSRGVTSRATDEGGDQERKLAEKYDEFATATTDAWPRTAAMLRRLAERYRDDARREDDDVAQREDLQT
jgi:hypothetical protein